MKKYYCPYCGSRSLRIGQKIFGVLEFTNYSKRCSSCGNVVALISHWSVYMTLVGSTISMILSVVFKSYVFLAIFLLLNILFYALTILLTRFVRRDGLDATGREYICSFDVSPCVKFPRLFFCGNSVLEIECENRRYPAIIELIDEDAVTISLIKEDGIDLKGKSVTFYDYEKEIGTGKAK
ncbi:MAG: hypothetical protein J5441_08140 [Clostridia bacterium]|nr:hypothetical protein [Clostridia bacterium]